MTVNIEIKWGTKKFNVELPEEDYIKMTVHQLKLHCQRLTEVEPEYMKLLSRGGKLDLQMHQSTPICLIELIAISCTKKR